MIFNFLASSLQRSSEPSSLNVDILTDSTHFTRYFCSASSSNLSLTRNAVLLSMGDSFESTIMVIFGFIARSPSERSIVGTFQRTRGGLPDGVGCLVQNALKGSVN